jgi:hypothetical protein
VDIMGNLLKLYGKLDPDTVALLGRFLVQALRADNSNLWVKEKLREILGDVPKPPLVVEVRSTSRK